VNVRLRDARIALHLAARELRATYRLTSLGWLWPLLRAGAQLAVFTVVFTSLLDSGIDSYPAHVFIGIIAFGWVWTGLPAAASSIVDGAPLLRRPGFPSHVLPVSALLVTGVDVLLALPFVAGAAIAADGFSARPLLLVPLVVAEFALLAGPAVLLASMTVFVRDIAAGLGVGLMLLFYATPVVYDVDALSGRAHDLIEANPATALVEVWRAALLGDPMPGAGRLAGLLGFSAVCAVVAVLVHRRHGPTYLDEL
jgi:ABC-type polysaccharide/polyol phosphate export permease